MSQDVDMDYRLSSQLAVHMIRALRVDEETQGAWFVAGSFEELEEQTDALAYLFNAEAAFDVPASAIDEVEEAVRLLSSWLFYRKMRGRPIELNT